MSRGSKRGLSLVEVLICFGLFSLVSLLLLESLQSGRKVTEHGAAQLKLQQDCRHLINRLTGLVISSASPIETQDALPQPGVGDGPTGELWFYSPDDFFGSATFDPRNPSTYLYRVRRDGARVLLERLQDNGTPMVTPPPRQLSPGVEQLEFERLATGLLRIRVTSKGKARGAHGDIPIQAELSTSLDLPFYTFQ